MTATVITFLVIFGYMIGMVVTGLAIGRYMYWYQGHAGSFDRFDSHGEAIGFGACLWPIALPLIIVYYLVQIEPRPIRKARIKKELEAFARREGLEI